MKREIIHITEDGKIVIPAVHPDKIRMDEAELVGLFNVVAPTLRAAKRRIYKLGILQPFTAEQRIPLKEGYQVVYNLEMIFALAFQINTYPAQQLREYIISRLFQSERHYKIFCVNGNTGFRNESRIFYFIDLQNEEDYERKESSNA